MLTENKGPMLLIGGGAIVFIVALVIVMTSLSGALVDSSMKELKLFGNAKSDTKTKEERYLQELNTQKGDIKIALDKAKFEKGFSQSKNLIKQSQIVADKMSVLIEKDDSKDEAELKKLLATLKKNTGWISRNNSDIVSKKNELVTLIKNIDTRKKIIENNMVNNKLQTEDVISTLKSSREKHPGKQADIDMMLKKANDSLADNIKLSTILAEQIKNKAYAEAYKTIKDIEVFITASSKENVRYKDLMGQLDKSYSKILTDMKTTYHVTVGRSTWDNWSDYDTTQNIVFPPVMVTEKDLDTIDRATGTIASGNPRNPSAKDPAWSILRGKINLSNNIKRSHDSSEFWVDDVQAKHYHKYTVVENTKKTETGWQQVDEQFFEKNYNNIGMEIVSKPYGKYELEKSTIATPPGMNMVGNKRYGEWRQGNDGNSFWHYYGMYSFWGDMVGRNSYSRYDYDNYRTHRRTNRTAPYYGSKKQYGTFGSSTRSNKKYKGSSYMRASAGKSATRMSSSRTVRGMGKSSRGRGSAGGGK